MVAITGPVRRPADAQTDSPGALPDRGAAFQAREWSFDSGGVRGVAALGRGSDVVAVGPDGRRCAALNLRCQGSIILRPSAVGCVLEDRLAEAGALGEANVSP